MPENDQAPAEAQDTPTNEAPEAPAQDTAQETGQEADVNWQERYEHLQPEYTRASQRASELEPYAQVVEALQDEDPDVRAQAAALLNIELAQQDTSEDDEFEDPYEQRLSQIEQMLGERQTVEQQQALEEAEVGFINEQLESIQKTAGHEFSEAEAQLIGDLSQVNRDDNGYPDVKAAYEHVFETFLPEVKKSWVDSKKAPRAAQGASAVENPSLDTERERVDYMAQRLAENEQ